MLKSAGVNRVDVLARKVLERPRHERRLEEESREPEASREAVVNPTLEFQVESRIPEASREAIVDPTVEFQVESIILEATRRA